jgi:sterol desaturase/sphingolipid hydroxylase (fatty acid hydroxylase superfamily)
MRPELITCAVIVLTWSVVGFFEWRAPLRETVEPKLRRTLRNLTTSVLSLLVGLGMGALLVIPAARLDLGLLRLVAWPDWAEIAVAVVLLDYTLWWWHWASHNVPLLWRFHLVHHVDRDLDASTALRFHFGEHLLSFFFRALQIVVIGAPLQAVWLWQVVLFASILFHHGNLRLPVRIESLLVRLIVTPRMHGIHHSERRGEAFTNYSSLLAAWDYLHRTICLAVPQNDVRIGVPAYQSDTDVTLGRILALPFTRQRDDWRTLIEPRAPVPSSTLVP